jgi:DNA invertase Pin-like site-specific DNA recombinase
MSVSAHLLPVPFTRTPLVFTYTRLSNDPDGKREDHETQWRHIDAVIARLGLPRPLDAHRFTDDDRSAHRIDVERPGWLALLEAIAHVDAKAFEVILIASCQDRLTRRLDELPALAGALEKKSGRLITHKESEISVKYGARSGLYLTGFLATNEAETITGRTRDGMLTAAMGGKRHGSVMWGWKFEGQVNARTGRAEGRDVIDPEAQALLLDMAERVLSGQSLRSIVDRLNTAGVPAPGTGRKLKGVPVVSTWTSTKVRQVLTREANIGVRVHRPGHVEGAERAEYQAAWPALMDRTTYDRVVAVLQAPERRTSLSNTATHLLSGIARCAVCGQTVTCHKDSSKKPRVIYRCERAHVVRTESLVDAFVEQKALTILADPELRAGYLAGRGDQESKATANLEALRARLANLETMWDRGDLTDAQFGKRNRELQPQIAEAERVLATQRDTAVYASLVVAEDVDQAWDVLTLAERRAVLTALFEVTIGRGRPGRRPFDGHGIMVTLRQAMA